MTRKLSFVAGAGLLALSSAANAQDPTPTEPPPPVTTDTQNPAPTTTPPPVDNEYTVPVATTVDEPSSYSEEPSAYSYAWREPRMRSNIGVAVNIGGGVAGFTDTAMRGVMKDDLGGLWGARISIGTHIPIGLDLNYVGTATSLQALGGLDNGTLLGTTAEAAVRYNMLPHFDVNPYLFAGVGWQRFDVQDAKLATSDTGLLSSNDVLEIPMGAGLSYRDRSGLLIDARGTFRAVTDSDLLRDANGNKADLHNWEASAAVGYEF